MVYFGLVRVKFERGNNFRKENPIAEFSADEVRVLADEAQTGSLCQIPFEDRAGIHIPQRTSALAAESCA